MLGSDWLKKKFPVHGSKPYKKQQKNMDDSRYKLDSSEKGLCLILNMENFSFEAKCLRQRTGTQKDEEDLRKIFTAIGFEVRVEQDKTADEVYKILNSAAQEDHKQRSSFVCVVLSHGDENGFYAKDDYFENENMFKLFKGNKCRSLGGKPKIFFIQACTEDRSESQVTHYIEEPEGKKTKIPNEADILCYYSTPPDSKSWKNETDGSWFIQTLCEMLERYWQQYDLVKILTRVNQEVASKYESCMDGGKREMPCIISKLTRLFYLK
ncbi:caspase-3-like isoform 2-T2 [Mantella aurantiaca]